MWSGVGAGILSVLFICGSYIFSREYLRRNKDAVKLAVFSQLTMMIGGVILLILYSFLCKIPWSLKLAMLLVSQVITFLMGQTAFFFMLRRVESSRASALLGLKILALALIALALGRNLSPWQWTAVLLCTVAAVGMNFSGGKIALSSCLWLLLSVLSYALCDMAVTELMKIMPGKSMLINSFGVVGLCYTAIGIAVMPMLLKYRFCVKEIVTVVPYSVFYFLSMIFLYTCFGLIGVVFGSIIQSSRGLVSVLLGAILVHYGLDRNERRATPLKWVQRFIFAVIMFIGIVMYSLNA